MALEDALILSTSLSTLFSIASPHTLNTPSKSRTSALAKAFQAYDEVRRPRAQRQVGTARETGEVYNLRDWRGGGDGVMGIEEVVRVLGGRFEWLWRRDLEGDVEGVGERVRELLQVGGLEP